MGYTNGSLYVSLVMLCSTFVSAGKAIEGKDSVKAKVSALFTFGDSIVDPGNNNFIPTLARANTPPYGQDFIDGKATGRFCNGKLSTDFISAELGLKDTVPPFLDPKLSTQDLLTGVSFASAGTGFDNLTAEVVSVIPVLKQVEYFKEYKARLTDLVGEENSSYIIREAIFLSIAGSNDFLENYYSLPNRRAHFSVEQYEDFLLNIYVTFIEDLYRLGGRKFGMYGLPPMGCVPLERSLYGQLSSGCVEIYNQAALSYNAQLMSTVSKLKTRLPGIKVVYVDIYYSSLDIIENPSKYGFETSSRGCCGTGLVETGIITCNLKTPVTCSDSDKFVFWDSVHPTQRAYQITAHQVFVKYISKLL
ncbi:GDSL esterase/lipase At2g42990 [Cryptomeria japonica]|uniref:GDSL esterase/lipase At2g42990 n=1 Tax=Cryptomeria japonica TaxID=3369 RepID=UPI0027DA497D|nr:GDSL esterase/lipase At2g42990 [Cryptomeria japonica]